MADLLEYLNIVLSGLGESEFGIVIENSEDFVSFLQKHPEFSFVPGPEIFIDGEDTASMWDSCLDGFQITHVCCESGCVVTPKIAGQRYKYCQKCDYTPENFTNLANLEKKLNGAGFKCKMGVLTKVCGCT